MEVYSEKFANVVNKSEANQNNIMFYLFGKQICRTM